MTPITVRAKRDLASPLVAAAGLEEPRRERPGHALVVQAWVIGAERAPSSFRIRHGDHTLREGPFNQPRPGVAEALGGGFEGEARGFRTGATLLGMPEALTVTIEAAFGGYEYVELWELDLVRTPVRAAADGMQPLLVTTLGRTGSTLLMTVLEAHPEVAVHPVWAGRPASPAEPRVLAYWLDVLTTLAAPTRYLRALMPDDVRPGWSLQESESVLPYPLDERIERVVDGDQVERTAEFARRQVTAFYDEIADLSSKPQARFFAEKFLPQPIDVQTAAELFPGARQVILVRDFRDMLASILALNAKLGHDGFARSAGETVEEYVRQLGRTVALLGRVARDAAVPSSVVRYEDLVRAPARTLTRLFDELGLGSGSEVLARTVGAVQARSPASDAHRTVSDAESSIGRWRRDLSPSVQEACREAFAGTLADFGYE